MPLMFSVHFFRPQIPRGWRSKWVRALAMKIFELLLTPVFSARFSHCNKVSRAPLLPKGWRTGLPIDCNAFASSLVLLHYLRELPLVVRELLAVLCLLDWYVVMLHSTCYFHPSIIVPSCSHAPDIHQRLLAACLCQAFSFCLLSLFLFVSHTYQSWCMKGTHTDVHNIYHPQHSFFG